MLGGGGEAVAPKEKIKKYVDPVARPCSINPVSEIL